MKKAYMKYYDGPSVLAPLRFFFDSLETRNANRRIALKNRSRDYSNLVKNPDLMDLHRRIHRKIREAVSEGDFYDYGEGYFYQSLRQIGISGFRDTEARIAAMRLEHWIRNKTVL